MEFKSYIKSKRFLFIMLILVFLMMSFIFPDYIFAGLGIIKETDEDDETEALYKLNLILLVNYDASDERIGEWEDKFNEASELLYNSTEGKMQIGTIKVFVNQPLVENIADIVIKHKGGAHADTGHLGEKGYQIYLYDDDLEEHGEVTIVHELGHYVFNLKDEYEGYKQIVEENKTWWEYRDVNEGDYFPPDAMCTGESSDPASLMDASHHKKSTVHRTEWCTPDDDGLDWKTDHNSGFTDEDGTVWENEQERKRHMSCWETIYDYCKRKYEILMEIPKDEPKIVTPPKHEDIEWIVLSGEPRTVIAIDNSQQMLPPTELELAKLGANIFVDIAEIGDEIGIISYNEVPEVIFPIQKIHDGPEMQLLKEDAAFPLYSPDGTKIAFTKVTGITVSGNGNYNMYLMNENGTGEMQLTYHSSSGLSFDIPAFFMPNGDWLSFTRAESGSFGAPVDFRNYTLSLSNPYVKYYRGMAEGAFIPRYSPYWKRIVYSAEDDLEYPCIYVQKPGIFENFEWERLTPVEVFPCWEPSFSPDGTKVLFTSIVDGSVSNSDICTMDVYPKDVDPDMVVDNMYLDLSSLNRLTDSPSYESSPCYSQDGSKIAFVSNPNGDDEIFMMDKYGLVKTRLTYNPDGYESNPCFSPDGKKVAFTSCSDDGNCGIYYVDITKNLEPSTRYLAKEAIDSISISDEKDSNVVSVLRTSLNKIINTEGYTGNDSIILISGDQYIDFNEEMDDVIKDIIEEGVRVYTVAIGDADEKALEDIAYYTKGKNYYAANERDLDKIFNSISNDVHSMYPIEELLEDYINPSEQVEESVYIDSFTDKAMFFLGWGGSDLDLTLVRPDGTVVDPEVAENDSNIRYVEEETYEFYEVKEPMVGDWQVIIDAIDVSGEEYFSLQVMAQASGVSFYAYTDKESYTYPEKILIKAEVKVEYPVAGAEVTGTVSRPDGSETNIILYDDGLSLHGDEDPDNGEYSNYFSEYNVDGEYVFDMKVVNTEGIQSFATVEFITEDLHPQLIDPFKREASMSVSVTGIPEELPTEISLDFPDSIQYSDMLSGKAILTSEEKPLEGKEVEFGCMLPVEKITTDEDGISYSTEYKVKEASGSSQSPICINFYGDDRYLPGYSEKHIEIEKENATLTYTGDTITEVGSSTALSCSISQEDDGYPGDITLSGPVTFTLTTQEGFSETYTADVNSSGIATMDIELSVGLYSVVASIDSDYYISDESSEETLAVYDPRGPFITGGGWFIPGGKEDKVNFGFEVKYKKDGTLKGNLKVTDHNTGTDYNTVGFNYMVVVGSKAYISGNLSIDGEGSYPFTAVIEGSGSPGSGSDRFSIDFEVDGEHIVFDEIIGSGSIVIHK
jgi:Tol biopolymer transport system component